MAGKVLTGSLADPQETFSTVLNKSGITNFRTHDLRHALAG